MEKEEEEEEKEEEEAERMMVSHACIPGFETGKPHGLYCSLLQHLD